MPLAPDSAATARLAAAVRGAAWLVELQFTSGTLRFTTAPVDVASGGFNWQGLGQALQVAAVEESADTSAARLSISVTAVNQAMLAAAIGNVDAYRGKRAKAYLQLFDEAFQPDGAATQRWTGYMDKVQVSRRRSPPEGGESVGRVELICSRAGMARARNNQGLRLTDAQQQQRHPGSTGLRYVRSLIEAPAFWLSKAFQSV